MRNRKFELAAWEVYECGKTWMEADADVAEAIDFCDYYAAEALKLDRPQHRDVPGEDNAYFYEPRGVAVVLRKSSARCSPTKNAGGLFDVMDPLAVNGDSSL